MNTPMTIRDYLAAVRPLAAAHLQPAAPVPAGGTGFQQVLEACCRPSCNGMTLADYRSRALPARIPPAEAPSACDATRPPAAPEREWVGPATATSPAPAEAASGSCHSIERHAVPGPPAGTAPIAAECASTDVRQKIDNAVRRAAGTYDLPADLLHRVIQAESAYRVEAVSACGAQGLMQLMPATAAELGVRDPFDIDQNIEGGARYLRRMLDRFDGDLKLALAAYNAGPGNVRRYGGVPPFDETRRYVSRIMASAAPLRKDDAALS